MTDTHYLSSFEALYDHFFDLIFRFVARRISDTETVQDIVSETFLKVYKNLSSFSPRREGALSSWIYTIAKNEIYQHLRRIKHHRFSAPDIPQDLPSPQDLGKEYSDEETHRLVMQELEQLKQEERELILYKYFDDLSNIEIASLLGVTANNVGVKLHRALLHLQEIMKKHNTLP